SELVDYRALAAAKRRILEPLSRSFHGTPSARREAFEAWLRANPLAKDYARFRAACESRGEPWPRWRARERDGVLPEPSGLVEQEAFRYHAYVQWLAEQQLASVRDGARTNGAGLYFDLP